MVSFRCFVQAEKPKIEDPKMNEQQQKGEKEKKTLLFLF